ncbi:MAG: hypothetical protein ABI480_01225 [Chitinophagaceae bacterium]
MNDKKNIIVAAALINAVLFTIFFLLFHPVYDSREDVYMLYLLSGGYGDAPTEMLHYNHIMHPFLGWLIKDLFLLNSHVNWYSLSLIAAHFISCTVILTCIIQHKNKLVAYISYAVLFIIFEGYFLLSLDFTGASLTIAIAALLFLLIKSWAGILRYQHCILAGVLLLLASLYRIHTIIPLIGVALPFLLLTIRKQAMIRIFVSLIVSGFAIFLLNKVHQTYYKVIKPNWAQEEQYRQKTFRFFNEQSSLYQPAPGEKWYNEHEVAVNGLVMDSSYMSSATLDSMYHDLKHQGLVHQSLSPEWKKWFFINNRLFFCAVLLFFLLYGLRKKILPATIISLVLLTAGFVYLLFRAKAPPYILISSLSFICFTTFLHSQDDFMRYKKLYQIVIPAALLLTGCWGIVRLYRTSQQNIVATWQFKQQYAEIAAHPDNLFIGLNHFDLHKFYVLDVPPSYPLTNYLHGQRFGDNGYHSTLERFGINNIQGIFSSPKVLFWGDLSEPQRINFEKIAGHSLKFSPVMEFKQPPVWKVE